MNRTAHKITRVVFEIGMRGGEQAAPIQARISAFAGGALETVLIQSLSALAREDHLLALDGIELNIGNISYQYLEEDLAAGIARCLREWVFRLPPHRLQSVESAGGLMASGGVSEVNASLLPAPASPRFSFSSSARRGGLNAAIAAALQGTGDWPQLMAAVRDNHAFRCRLANEVSLELLRGLLRVLMPAEDDMIAEIYGVLAAWHDSVSLASAGSHAFRRVLWECILNEVARCQPARFSLRSFVAGVLTQLSARYSLERSVFSSRIRESLRQHGQVPPTIMQPAISTGLRQTLSDWLETPVKSLAHATAARVPQDAMTAKSSRSIDRLAKFLEWGALPWSAVSGSSRDLDSEILESMAASPDDVCSLVCRLGEMQPVRKRIAGQLSDKGAQQLIGALDPVNATWIFLCQRSLRRMHAQKPLVALQNRIFAQLLQELTLEYLAERHWHALDAESFMRFVLQGLATRQKTEYELLLADVALRRSPKSRDTGAQSLVNSAIITLLEEDVLGVRGLLLSAPRFVVRPAFQHRYCDLDVLAYWLRWRKLPAWSFAATPEEMARRIGPLLRGLPAEVRTNALGSQAKTAIVNAGIAHAPVPALKIERWLLYGIWPANVSLPQNTSLAEWLESQGDSDWLQALRRSGTQDSAVQRLVNHLSPTFLVRIISLVAGPRAQTVYGLLCSLSVLKRHMGATISQQWEEQVTRYVLICLLQQVSSDSRELSGVEELAQTTLQALSLRCQVPYERLLLLWRQESQGKEAQLDLCLKLEAKLDRLEAKTDLSNPNPAQGPDLVLHYLKHGSLPENASGFSFHALQQLASRLTEDEMTSIAQVAVPWFAGDREIARRTAILFLPPAFARLAALLFPGIRFAEEIERSLLVLASRRGLQLAALLIAGRTFFLQHAACHAANFSTESVISGMLEGLAEYTGEPQSTLVEHLVHATGSKGVFADALASLRRETRFMRTEFHVPVVARTAAQPADGPA
ncbi:MAG TPA: contractile injection system tape measure protein, partial [Alphaproteobacteria bacterium]|nr:contractile injection system tape measure protein [Alphaproteobacteria bacterium]